MDLLDSRAETPPESVLRLELRWLGYDVEPQFEIEVDGVTYRADLRLRGTRLLIEFDRQAKYLDPREEDRERRRRRSLEARGWRFVRFTWNQLGQPEVQRAMMASAIAALPTPTAA